MRVAPQGAQGLNQKPALHFLTLAMEHAQLGSNGQTLVQPPLQGVPQCQKVVGSSGGDYTSYKIEVELLDRNLQVRSVWSRGHLVSNE